MIIIAAQDETLILPNRGVDPSSDSDSEMSYKQDMTLPSSQERNKNNMCARCETTQKRMNEVALS